MRGTLLGLAAIALTLAVAARPMAQAPADSSRVELPTLVVTDTAAVPTPGSALWRSLAVPGWGQIYVGQSVKAPFVIGALGGLAGLSVFLNARYSRYRHAYLYVVNESAPDPSAPNPANPHAEFFQDWVDTGAQSATTVRQLRDSGRRNRDLAILGTGLVYALQALDAYVAAHLIDFDVSEDLSLQVLPTPEGPQMIAILRF